MNIYNFHPKTGEYLGEGKADQDPKDPDNWLIPAFAVTEPPPDAQEGKVRYFDGEWKLKDEDKQEPSKDVDPKDAVKRQVAELEATLTQRKILEMLASGDNSFAVSLMAQIEGLEKRP